MLDTCIHVTNGFDMSTCIYIRIWMKPTLPDMAFGGLKIGNSTVTSQLNKFASKPPSSGGLAVWDLIFFSQR